MRLEVPHDSSQFRCRRVHRSSVYQVVSPPVVEKERHLPPPGHGVEQAGDVPHGLGRDGSLDGVAPISFAWDYLTRDVPKLGGVEFSRLFNGQTILGLTEDWKAMCDTDAECWFY